MLQQTQGGGICDLGFRERRTVMTKHQWHTLKERQPADGEYCLLTVETTCGPYDLVPAEVFEWINGRFIPVQDTEFLDVDDINQRIVAWMPLPQPYHGKESA